MLFLFTTVLTAFYTFWACAELSLKVIDLISRDAPKQEWEHILNMFAACCSIWIMVYALKKLMDCRQKCRKLAKDKRAQDSIISGLSLIAIFAFPVRLFLADLGEPSQEMEGEAKLVLSFFVNCIAATYRLLIYKPTKDYEWKKQCSWVFVFFFGILVAIHTIAFYPIISEATKFTFVYQIAFALICATSTLELYAISTGKLKLKEEVELESVRVVDDKKRTNPTEDSVHFEYSRIVKHDWISVNLIIGLCFIATMSFAARFQLEDIVDEKREEALEIIVLFVVSWIAASYRLFIYKSAKQCEWKKQCSWTFVFFFGILVAIHSIAFYPLVSGAAKSIVVYQVAFALIFATSTLELYAIFMGKLKLKEEVELQSVQVDANKKSPNSATNSEDLEKPDFVKMWNEVWNAPKQ